MKNKEKYLSYLANSLIMVAYIFVVLLLESLIVFSFSNNILGGSIGLIPTITLIVFIVFGIWLSMYLSKYNWKKAVIILALSIAIVSILFYLIN